MSLDDCRPSSTIFLLILHEFAINHFYLHKINEMHWDINQHHKKPLHLIEIHTNDTPKHHHQSPLFSQDKSSSPYFRIYSMEYSKYPPVCNTIHHRIKHLEQQVHKQHESNWIPMLAKMDYNDLLLDIMNKSIRENKIIFLLSSIDIPTGSSTRAKQGVQNQYSDGDDESDDLSSKASAL